MNKTNQPAVIQEHSALLLQCVLFYEALLIPAVPAAGHTGLDHDPDDRRVSLSVAAMETNSRGSARRVDPLSAAAAGRQDDLIISI